MEIETNNVTQNLKTFHTLSFRYFQTKRKKSYDFIDVIAVKMFVTDLVFLIRLKIYLKVLELRIYPDKKVRGFCIFFLRCVSIRKINI